MNQKNQTLYELLGVSQDATLAEIKTAYRKLTTKYHPDLQAGLNNEDGHKMMCQINEAYSVLRNPELREAYDKVLLEMKKSASEDDSTLTSNSSNNFAENNSNKYQYYNSVDFDDNTQEEFVEWIDAFSDRYMRVVFDYYKKVGFKNEKIIMEVYSSLFNVVDYEKNVLKLNRQYNRR